MRLTRPTRIEWAVIGVVLLILAVLIVPPTEAVWDGHFSLTVSIHENEPIDPDSLIFATFWRSRDADDAVRNPGLYEGGFHRPAFKGDGQAVINVQASGRLARIGGWRITDTYNHPEFLIVEYRLATDDRQTPARKRFQIPKGRGPRSMTIDLP